MKTCPFLLRCFWKNHRNNNLNAYRMAINGILPTHEVQIYTWPDATLRELCELLRDVIPGLDDNNASLEYSLVFIDRNGDFGIKQVTKLC